MAIGFGVACPKGKTRKQIKAKKDREDAALLKIFRDRVWQREANRWYAELPGVIWAMATVARCQHCKSVVTRAKDSPLTGEVHHRISRRHKAMRYDPDNGVLLCNFLVNGCHERAERGEIEV